MFNKEDATFVPSGVFGNQAMLLSVGKPGEEVIAADKSHIFRYENGSIGFISRMMARTIPSTDQGFI
jgi:threonine aldolase